MLSMHQHSTLFCRSINLHIAWWIDQGICRKVGAECRVLLGFCYLGTTDSGCAIKEYLTDSKPHRPALWGSQVTVLSGRTALGKGRFPDKGLREAGTNSTGKDRRRCAAMHLWPELSLVTVSFPLPLLSWSLLLWTLGGHTEKRSAKTTRPTLYTQLQFYSRGEGSSR